MTAKGATSLHTFRWFLPTSIRSRDKYVEFDLTKFCQTFFSRSEYYIRRTTFDRKAEFDQSVTSAITSVSVQLYPFVSFPMSNTRDSWQIIEKEIGHAPELMHIIDRGNLRHAHGLAIIVLSLNNGFHHPQNLQPDEEYDIEKRLNWDMDFEIWKLQLISIANDIGAFFMLGLHLTYLTHSTWHESHPPQSSGLVAITDSGNYLHDEHSDMLSYPLLFEAERINTLNEIWETLSKVWHKDLWSIHRFIKAVRSDHSTIDHFVDLVVTLESFFPDNTPQPLMRLIASIIVSTDKKGAKKIDKLLIDCFRIRNEVVHGGKYYRLHDKGNNHPDAKMILQLFWDLKNLNIHLIHYGVDKLLKDQNSIPANAIRLTQDDILDKLFI
ncbi:MAG: hypothetical protein ACXVJN_11165 [Mucilaginibacter sp.]